MLKPMNCPHHCEIYRSAPHSYKDLPLRYAEFGTVYRYEQSGELHGLTRVRGFTQDDAHLFCRQDQIQEEFEKVIDLILYVFKTLHFDKFTAQVSLRDPKNPSKYIGSDENWEKAEAGIIEAAKKKGLPFVVETGEAAFYGPKLDFMVKDAIGRSWQLGTIQVDYNLPERFELEYLIALAVVLVVVGVVIALNSNTADTEAATQPAQKETKAPAKPQKPAQPQYKVHAFQKGESLTTISVLYYGTSDSVERIQQLNGLTDTTEIQLGTELKLP